MAAQPGSRRGGGQQGGQLYACGSREGCRARNAATCWVRRTCVSVLPRRRCCAMRFKSSASSSSGGVTPWSMRTAGRPAARERSAVSPSTSIAARLVASRWARGGVTRGLPLGLCSPLPLCDHLRCSPGACCWHPLEHLHCRGGPLRRAHRLARPRPTRRRAASIAQSARLLLSSDLVSVPWIVGGIRSELGSLVGYFVRPQTSSSPSPGYIDVRAAHPAPACAALPKRAPASELRETTMYPIGQAGGAG